MGWSGGAWYVEIYDLKRSGTACPLQWFKNNEFFNTFWYCITYTTPVVGSLKKMNNTNKDLVIQEPVESIASWQWRATIAPYESVSSWGPRRSQRISKPVFSDDYEVYVSEEIQIEGDPTSFEEAMRSVYSFKWQEAMKVEMNSMNTNDVWDSEVISNGVKTVGC